jgi:hypothetical protein
MKIRKREEGSGRKREEGNGRSWEIEKRGRCERWCATEV